MPPLGFHSLFDFHACDVARLADREVVRAALLDAVREAGGTVVAEMFHQFEPHGVSGVVVIAESHLTVHTWPERAFAAVDLFTCSPTLEHGRVEASLVRALGAGRVERSRHERG
ncbi:MAG: adenosylmethionine decarboxylase [Verrucomicrobia bacterium]|nr:adenosylmethionine decarboxylase [Verrucomicrobiota bacterium]